MKNKLYFLVVATLFCLPLFSKVAIAGVGKFEATTSNENSSSRLKQKGCVDLGKMVLGSAYKGISGENIYLEKCTTKSACGKLYGKYHPGVDYKAQIGTRVFSPIDGKVVGIDAANGTVSIQKKGSATRILFGHLNEISVSVGTNVTVGCSIGKSGKRSAYFPNMAPHLHIEARTSGNKMLGYFTSRSSRKDTKDPALIPPKFVNVPGNKILRCQ